MFKKYNWQQPYNKDDLKHVLLMGFISAVLLGILSGLVDFLVSLLGVQIDFGLVILSMGIMYTVNRSYERWHILYAVLTIPMMIVGLFFGFFALYFCIDPGIHAFKYLISGGFYISFLRQPFYGLISGLTNGQGVVAAIGALNLVIYILAFYYCYYAVARNGRTA